MSKLIQRPIKAQTSEQTNIIPFLEGDEQKSLLERLSWETFLSDLNNVPEKLQNAVDKYNSINNKKYKVTNNNKYKSTEKSSKGDNGGDNKSRIVEYAGMLAKPVLGAATLLYNLDRLKKTRDAAKNIKAPTVLSPTAPVRPMQQLPPEVIAQQEAAIGSLQPRKYADATLMTVSSDMLNKQKLDAENKLAVLQASTLDKERARYDKQTEANAVRNVEALNKALVYDADVSNKKAAIDAAYQKALQETMNKAGSDVMEGIHQRALYNEAARKQNALGDRQSILDKIAIKQNTLAALGNTNPALSKTLAGQIDDLLITLNDSESYSLPGYNGVMAGTFKFKNGGRLIKRGGQNG